MRKSPDAATVIRVPVAGAAAALAASIAMAAMEIAMARTPGSLRAGQCPLEVVEAASPAALVRAHRLLVPQAAVREPHGGRAVRGLLEIHLDQHPLRVVVPDPGEREATRRLDLRVAAAAPVLVAGSGVAHHHAHLAADAQVDARLGRLPVVLGVPPAPHHLFA